MLLKTVAPPGPRTAIKAPASETPRGACPEAASTATAARGAAGVSRRRQPAAVGSSRRQGIPAGRCTERRNCDTTLYVSEGGCWRGRPAARPLRAPACAVQGRKHGTQHSAGGNSSWCPGLEVWTTHRTSVRHSRWVKSDRNDCRGAAAPPPLRRWAATSGHRHTDTRPQTRHAAHAAHAAHVEHKHRAQSTEHKHRAQSTSTEHRAQAQRRAHA